MFNPFAVPKISGADAQARLAASPPPYILDVRQPEEYAQGHIPGSHLIPLGQLSQHVQALPKDQEILVVCKSGARSAQATSFLVKSGYRAVNVAGGMQAWRGPVEV